jgi:hypothetical protein
MGSWKMQTSKQQSSWNKFCGLTWQERWLLLKAFVFLSLIGAGLHLMNFQRLRALLVRFSPDTLDVYGEDALEPASGTSRLVQAAAARMPFTVTCLVRSTALWYMLRRQGIDSEIRIGVNQQEGGFHAHAWVEIDGIVLNDREDIHHQFVPFEQITMPDNTERI